MISRIWSQNNRAAGQQDTVGPGLCAVPAEKINSCRTAQGMWSGIIQFDAPLKFNDLIVAKLLGLRGLFSIDGQVSQGLQKVTLFDCLNSAMSPL